MDLGNNFDAAGYDMTALEATYNKDDSISVYVKVNSLPDDGPSINVVPLIAIVAGIGALLGGVILVVMLSKVEAILNLPVVWVIGGLVFISMVPLSIKGLKRGAG